MIKIIRQERNTLYYKCENCGAKGMCTIKPTKEDTSIIVIEIICPVCNEAKRVTFVQYDSEENKKTLLDNLDDFDISWVLTKNEETLDEKE